LPDLPIYLFYSAAIASVGQEPAQAPQSAHLEASIQRLSFFSEIASVGQSLSQAPQFEHLESSIL
jgi:hypothetical protein